MLDSLNAIGWPTEFVYLDFEAYWDSQHTLSKQSYVEFVNDSRFQITGLGVLCGDDASYADTHEGLLQLRDGLVKAYGPRLEGCVVIGHNLFFDAYVLKQHFGIIPKYTIDTLCLARVQDSRADNSLRALCRRYNLPTQKGENAWTKGRSLDSLTDDERAKLREYCEKDVQVTKLLSEKLLQLLPCPEFELYLQNQTLRMFLEPRLMLDIDMAKSLQTDMKLALAKSLRQIPWVMKYKRNKSDNRIRLVRSNVLAKILADLGVDVPYKPGKKGPIPAFAKTDVEFQALCVHENKKVRDVCNARVAARSWPTWEKRVQSMVKQAEAQGGYLGVPLLYYGAHTGRDSGTQNINLQNLPGPGTAGFVTDPILQKLRHCVIAEPGHRLVINDLSQIEARITAWLAGQTNLVKGFADSVDVYSQFATKLFGSIVRKSKASDPPGVAKALGVRRAFGKAAILGCGYGMGANRFYDNCYANKSLRTLFESGQCTKEFVRRLVYLYRDEYSSIVRLWDTMETAMRAAIKYPQLVTSYDLATHTLGHSRRKGGINIYTQADKKRTVVQLPSGRELYYPVARISLVGEDIHYKYGKLWGGSLIENIVQAMARDLFMSFVPTLEAAGMPVVLRAHDELVCVATEQEAESCLACMSEIMTTLPQWAAGLPVAVEGTITPHYVK